MPINYFINKTKLNGDTHYVGRVSLKGSYDRDMLISRMLEMGTSLGKEDITGVISLLEKAMYNICLEGSKVTLDGFMQFTPTISGTFDGETDGFDKSKNRVYISAQVSTALNNDFSNDAGVEKVIPTEKKPYLLEVMDNDTGEANHYITRNNIVSIYGAQMKFDKKSTDEYLRFVNYVDSAQYVDIKKCQKVTDKEIVFLMPDVDYNKGYFEIGSKMGSSTIKVGKSQAVDVK